MAVTEPIRHSSTRARVVAMNDGVRSERTDTLATEEPLEIRVQGPEQEPVQVAVTMRTSEATSNSPSASCSPRA